MTVKLEVSAVAVPMSPSESLIAFSGRLQSRLANSGGVIEWDVDAFREGAEVGVLAYLLWDAKLGRTMSDLGSWLEGVITKAGGRTLTIAIEPVSFERVSDPSNRVSTGTNEKESSG